MHIIKKYGEENQGCEIVIGTPNSKKSDFINDKKITLLDTTTDQDYLNTLQSLDILVTNYDRDRYLYRASGVINDAGACGCYIIAPDYPLIKNQVNYPVPIGLTYQNIEEIEGLIDQAINHVRNYGQDNQWQWRQGRDAKAIAKIFQDQGWK